MAMQIGEDLYLALDAAYDALNDAYWAASTIRAKDRIKGVLDVLDDILTDLNRNTFASRQKVIDKLGEDLKTANAQLDALKSEIDKIVHAVTVAAAVVKFTDRAIGTIAKYV